MIKEIKTALAPGLASLGVIAHWKGWHNRAVSFIDRAKIWVPELEGFEGGYYELYRLLSLYKIRPDASVRGTLLSSLDKLKAYASDDHDMNESLDLLRQHADEEIGLKSGT